MLTFHKHCFLVLYRILDFHLFELLFTVLPSTMPCSLLGQFESNLGTIIMSISPTLHRTIALMRFCLPNVERFLAFLTISVSSSVGSESELFPSYG